ncbi:MAG: hypothetical protein ABIX01_04610 [Chitinophagaceae bacterium]
MKKINSKAGLAVLSITLSLFILISIPNGTSAQSKKGAITEKEVKDYFKDWWDQFCKGGNTTKDMCTISFDGPVRIAPLTSHTFQLTGTYNCYPVKVDFTTAYSNAGISVNNITHFTHAVYYFYRNSFGDWEMGKEGERTTEEQKNKYATPQSSSLPKPDFSAFEQWYEIVKYEYPTPPAQQMLVYFKPKGKERPWYYEMEFRDKNGVIIGRPMSMFSSAPLSETEIGATGILKIYTPLATEMGRIASAKMIVPH